MPVVLLENSKGKTFLALLEQRQNPVIVRRKILRFSLNLKSLKNWVFLFLRTV